MSTTLPTSPPAPTWGKRLGRALFLLVIGFAVLVALYLWAMIRFSYSEGERAGYVQKFSRKGWVCKTWEGELAMATLPGVVPQLYTFTVWDEDVAAQINRQVGQRVVLHYKEKVGLPTSCFGDTRYVVDQIRAVAAP